MALLVLEDRKSICMKTKIDVIIPTRNRGLLIVDSIKSLQANPSQDFRVWIVDQSENTLTADAVQPFVESDHRFSLISTNTKGADIARNIGIEASEAPIVGFIDDDCQVESNWIKTLLHEYETHPNISSIFGRVIPVEAPANYSNENEVSKIKRLHQVLPMAKKDEPTHHIYNNKDRFNLSFGHGANMSFRRSTFAKIGLFDEYLGGGAPLKSWEERDLGYRIIGQGGQILYSPDVVVYHKHWREWPDVRDAFIGYAIGAGAVVGKYMRLGDWQSFQLLVEWMLQQGFKQIASGIFKWKSLHKTKAGLLQLIYPWVGLWQCREYAIDKEYCIFVGEKKQIQTKTPIEPFSTTPET